MQSSLPLPDDVLELFGQASHDSRAWLPAIRALASATRSSLGQLIGIGGPAVLQFNLVDLPADADADFLAIGAGSPKVSTRVAAGDLARPMQVAHEPDYDAVRPTLQTDIYRDFERKWDIPHGAQATLERSDDALFAVAMLRSESDGRTTPEQVATFSAALPFVRAALRTQLSLGGQGARLLAGALEAVSSSAFLLDAGGVLQAATPAAEAMLSAGRLRLRDGRLCALDPLDDRRLQSAVALALSGSDADPAARQQQVMLRGAGAPMVLLVDRLRNQETGFIFSPRVLVTLGAGPPRPPRTEALRAAYGLTESEALIALSLARGVSRAQVAAERGVSLGTVRQQVKSIFQKVGVHREAELVLAVHQAP